MAASRIVGCVVDVDDDEAEGERGDPGGARSA